MLSSDSAPEHVLYSRAKIVYELVFFTSKTRSLNIHMYVKVKFTITQ